MNKEVVGYLFQRRNDGIQTVDDEHDERPSTPFVGNPRDIRPVVLLQRNSAASIERRARAEEKNEDGITASAKAKPFSKFGVVFPLPHDHLDDIFLSCGGIDW